MEKPYTHTTWLAKAEHEADFVELWSEWVEWSHRQGLEANAMLLRDVENPRAFVSFGRWEGIDAVRDWRTLSGYKERVARLGALVERFEPRILEVVERR